MFYPRLLIQRAAVGAAFLFSAGCAHIPPRSPASQARVQADVPILLYHHIAPVPPSAGRSQKLWTLSPEKFDAQMGWIRRQGFHPVTMAQLIRHLKEGLPLPAKPVVICFDDGWKDQYRSAFPILKKYNFPATFFVITDFIGHSDYMSWGQVTELLGAGMDIQDHSRTHRRLSVLRPEEAREEIAGSKKILESRLKKPVNIFAYPFGSYDDDVIAIVKDAGFDAAVTVEGSNGGYLLRVDHSYVLPRYAVRGTGSLGSIAEAVRYRGPLCSAMFVSLLQEPPVFSSRERIDGLIDFAARSGIDTLFVQVYRENKSWFPSRIADQSPYEKCLRELSGDPLALLINRAHLRGIQVHAWMNMLSLAQNKNARLLKKYSFDVLTRNMEKKGNPHDYLIDNQYFLEPGDPRVKRDLCLIVRELLCGYPDLDGIAFDYIRYPDSEPHYGYTASNMKRFKKTNRCRFISEDSQQWKEWKRSQVSGLLSALAQTARTARPGIQVSATGCMPYTRAYYEAYQDWPGWLNGGLVDFVTAMSYSPHPQEFRCWLAAAGEKVGDPSAMKIGIGVYKLSGKPRALERELEGVSGLGMSVAIFHYGSLLESPELQAIVIRVNRESRR